MSLSTVSQTALSGIWASQQMLGAVADNLANLATPGFQQSQVQVTEAPVVGQEGRQVGTGVEVSGIKRDTFQSSLLPRDTPYPGTLSSDDSVVPHESDGGRDTSEGPGLGQVGAESQESSNTDLAQNIIDASRAELLFRANLKVLSVAEEMSDELMQLLRR